MREPERAGADAGFSGVYRSLVETYRIDPQVSAGQLNRIMSRLDDSLQGLPRNQAADRKLKGEPYL